MKQPMKEYKPAEKLELKEIKKEFPKVFKKVCCPSCDEDVPSDNLNLQHKIAKCASCDVLFSIEEEVESIKVTKETKQEIFRPEGIDLFFYKDDLEISVQQHIQGIDAFGIVILPLLALLTIAVYFFGKTSISAFFPIVSSLGASYFLYKGFNYSKNKSYIDINDQSLSIKSRPKNFKKDKTYAADEIDQLYLKHATDGSGYYSIHMIINTLEGQKHEKLLTVNTISKAKYLEQEIERYLNIEDRAIPESNIGK